MKRTVRYTDQQRYRIPYVREADSRKPGYLAKRFDKLCPGWRSQPAKQP